MNWRPSFTNQEVRGIGMAKSEETVGTEKGGAAVAPALPKSQQKTAPKKKPPRHLPLWKVLLHNDDKNDVLHVVSTIMELTPLNSEEAKQRMKEAHHTGVALLLVTHK